LRDVRELATIYLGLGSNLGDREKNLRRALKELKSLNSVKILKKSSIYETEPVGFKDQNWFLNAVIKIKTQIPPLSLFYLLKGIEKRLGRTKGKRWGSRKIDLDLLLYDGVIMNEDKLILPHPQMHKRRFVLIPLLELDRGAKHPVLNLTFKKLLENIEKSQEVKLFSKEWKS
jgi:2-amino-4-hydroxy-6-hydroxymethyldihydropteridine diphosphokinase